MKLLLLTSLAVLSSVTAAEQCGATQPTEPIEAQEGGKVTLQCCTDPPTDLKNHTLVCKRFGGNFNDPNRHIYSRRRGQENPQPQTERYRNRTHVVHEDLSKGVLSLQIILLQLNDSGQYMCRITHPNIICNFTVAVSRQKDKDAVVMMTPSVEAKMNPETNQPPNVWNIVIPVVIAAVAVVLMIIGVLWKFRNTQLCEDNNIL